jgi:hypothetical protein
MAKHGIIIPCRNDVLGANLQVEELWPNTSQKNSVYDGEGQSGYINQMMDQPGATVFTGEAYTSGSRMTTAASVGGGWALAAAVNWSGDGGHAGNDVRATAVPMFGLAAYLRERVVNDPTGGATTLAAADVDLIVGDIIDLAFAGSALTIDAINGVLQARCGAGSGDGTEVLNNFGGSFGTVQDVLRILSGEVYYVPTNCIIADEAGVFMTYEHPDGVGQDGGGGAGGGTVNTRLGIIHTLAGAGLTADPAPVATGRFLTVGEAGYVAKRMHALNTAFRASAQAGKLRELHNNLITIQNPDFAYTAAAVTAWRPRALNLDGSTVAANGSGQALRVYDDEGNTLNVP